MLPEFLMASPAALALSLNFCCGARDHKLQRPEATLKSSRRDIECLEMSHTTSLTAEGASTQPESRLRAGCLPQANSEGVDVVSFLFEAIRNPSIPILASLKLQSSEAYWT